MHFLLFVFLVGLGAVAASAAVCAAYGWRGKVLLHGRPFQYGIVMIGVPPLLIGSVAFAATDRTEGRAIAVALAALPGILFLCRGQGRAARLTRPTADTVLEVVAGLRRSRPPAGTTSMAFEVSVLSDAQKLLVARRFDAAAEILGLLEWDLLEGLVLIQAALLLSRCYVESNLFNQGRETLERARETLVKDGGAEEKADYALLDARFVVHGERPNELGGQHVGVMHRDVCPANILIGLDGVAKLADFGIARAGDAVVGLDHGERRGKKGYAAPERTDGMTVPQSDLYSVAVVAWEILRGRDFATCGDPNQILEREGIPLPIAEVVLKSLSPNPRKRHTSADAFADELERAGQKTGCTGSTRDVAEWATRVFERPYDCAGSSAPGLHPDRGTLRTTVALEWPTPSSVDIPAVTTTADNQELPRKRPWRQAASLLAMAAVMLVGPLAWSARDGGAQRTVVQSRQVDPGLVTDTDAPRLKQQPVGPRLSGGVSSFHKATPQKATRQTDSTAPTDHLQPPSAAGPRLGFTNPYE